MNASMDEDVDVDVDVDDENKERELDADVDAVRLEGADRTGEEGEEGAEIGGAGMLSTVGDDGAA